jgi:L-rhamnose mutarotase
MTAEQKKAVIESLPELLKGATIGQLNMFVESGAKAVYQELHVQDTQKPADVGMVTPQGKKAIMEYVGRLRPLVKEQYQEKYDQIWEGILEISQVKAVIYDKGKQQDTTFNRNLLAQLIHQVDVIYLPSANNAQMTTYLEPERGADHPVRQKLGETPEKTIKKAVEEYMKDHLE